MVCGVACVGCRMSLVRVVCACACGGACCIYYRHTVPSPSRPWPPFWGGGWGCGLGGTFFGGLRIEGCPLPTVKRHVCIELFLFRINEPDLSVSLCLCVSLSGEEWGGRKEGRAVKQATEKGWMWRMEMMEMEHESNGPDRRGAAGRQQKQSTFIYKNVPVDRPWGGKMRNPHGRQRPD